MLRTSRQTGRLVGQAGKQPTVRVLSLYHVGLAWRCPSLMLVQISRSDLFEKRSSDDVQLGAGLNRTAGISHDRSLVTDSFAQSRRTQAGQNCIFVKKAGLHEIG